MEILGHEIWGRGPSGVIVLNDWLCDTTTWEDARRYLDRQAFTWAFADLRGYGRSRLFAGPFDLRQSVEDVLRLADNLGWAQFTVVGHSMSSLIALHLAQHHSDRVSKAVVIAPPPITGFGADDAFLAQLRQAAFDEPKARTDGLKARWGDRLGDGWIAYKSERWMASAAPEAVADYSRMFGRDGLPDSTAQICRPLLAITGEEDIEPMRRAHVTAMLGAIAPRLTVVPLLQCAHYPMQEAPPLTVAVLERFLSSSDADAGAG